MNKFSFHPVGQGLFYTGSILDGYYNFVYDCGKSINNSKFEVLIDDFTNHIQEIDFIVISHLHNDHFNGLPMLLDLCRTKNIKINKIILPYLYGFRNIAHFLLALSIFDEEVNLNSDEYMELYYLMCGFYNGNIQNNYEIPIEFIDANKNEFSKCVFGYPQLNKPIWEFHLLNKKISYLLCKQLDSEIQNLLCAYKMNDLVEFIENYKTKALDEIKKIYKKVLLKLNLNKSKDKFIDLNVSSIVMIHYPVVETRNTFFSNKTNIYYDKYYKRKRYLCCRNECFDILEISPVNFSLLTGDVKFDNYMLNYVKNLANSRIAIMQVPHHGSKDNYQQIKGLFADFDYYVISFGLGNKYNHPNIETIDCILSDNKSAKIWEVNQLIGLYYYIY